jgi:hypothetical protein
MTRVIAATFAACAFVSFISVQTASAAQSEQVAPRPQPSQVPAQAAAPKAETAKGELQSVDPEKKTVTLAGGQVFHYTEATKVIGGQKGVEGLATMSGRQVTVTYTMKGNDRIASSIEVAAAAK